eukprot:3178332-Pleurochrysis_carterae.AAC.1
MKLGSGGEENLVEGERELRVCRQVVPLRACSGACAGRTNRCEQSSAECYATREHAHQAARCR